MMSESTNLQAFSSQNWGQIKFASKLIAKFSSKEDKSVERWIDRCNSITQKRRVSEETLVTAAINQLEAQAQYWYNHQKSETIVTWLDFESKVRAYFVRRESISMIIARMNSRTWKTNAEKFLNYAVDKLNLMQFLQLSEREKIEMLTDGVKNLALRRFVIDMQTETVPRFISRKRRMAYLSIAQKIEKRDLVGGVIIKLCLIALDAMQKGIRYRIADLRTRHAANVDRKVTERSGTRQEGRKQH